MTDVNLGEVVEVLDPLFSQTVYQLISSVYFVVLPSAKKKSMIHLPLVVSALSPSSQDYCGTVVWSFQRCTRSDSVNRTLNGPKPDAA